MFERLTIIAILAALAGCNDPQVSTPAIAPEPAVPMYAATWHTKETLGPTVFIVDYSLTTAGECTVLGGASTTAEAPGLAALVIGFSGSGELQFAVPTQHVAIASGKILGQETTQHETVESGVYGGGGGKFGAGRHSLAIVAPNVKSGAFSEHLNGGSLGFDISCDVPFHIEGARIGHELALATMASLDGNGLGIGNQAMLASEGQLELLTNASTVYAVFSDPQGVARQIRLDHPSGASSWGPTDTVPPQLIQGGPGEYRFTVTRIGVDDHFWCAILASEGPFDLARGQMSVNYTRESA